VGYWKDEAAISAQWKANRRFNPEMRKEAVAALRAGWRKALDRSKAWDR
jgi:glycerol kinase